MMKGYAGISLALRQVGGAGGAGRGGWVGGGHLMAMVCGPRRMGQFWQPWLLTLGYNHCSESQKGQGTGHS